MAFLRLKAIGLTCGIITLGTITIVSNIKTSKSIFDDDLIKTLFSTNKSSFILNDTSRKCINELKSNNPIDLKSDSSTIPELISFHNGFKKLFDLVRPSVVVIYISIENEPSLKLLGTGLIYKTDGSIITAAHLFTESDLQNKKLIVRMHDNTLLDCSLKSISTEADIAILKINNQNYTETFSSIPLKSCTLRPNQGEFIASYGASQHGDKPIAVVGIVCQPYQSFLTINENHYCRYIQLGMITLPGMSGSPVFDVFGNVVAILVKKYEDYGLALPSQFVSNVIHCLESHGVWSPISLGIDVVTTQFNGLERLKVHSVKDSSLAKKYSIFRDDILLSINGQPIFSFYDIIENLSNSNTELIHIEVSRMGINKTIFIDPRSINNL